MPTKRHPMWIFPAKHSTYDVIEEAEFQFQDVVWIQDFGIFKAGEQCKYVVVNFEHGTVKEFNEEGYVTRGWTFTALSKEKL